MAINSCVILGRITAPLEIKQTQSGTPVLQFTVAVDRDYTKQGERQTDFITCVAWRQTAEFIGKYFGKGRMIALTGSLRTRTYEDKNGTKHYLTEVMVDSASFTGESKQGADGSYNGSYNSEGNYTTNSTNGSQNAAQTAQSESIGDLNDFEEILSDDGVPF